MRYIILLLLFMIGCTPEVTNFDECLKQGGNIGESYPRQCFLGDKSFTEVIGGDDQGCLVGAGYVWDESVSACLREWEFDEDQKKAATIAIMPLSFRPVTLIDVQTLECEGCFVVTLKTQEEFEINLIDWKQTKSCTKEYVPVCGVNNKTYSNECNAGDIEILHQGECCGPCAFYSLPYPDWCENGTIVDGGEDDCGCMLPPDCIR